MQLARKLGIIRVPLYLITSCKRVSLTNVNSNILRNKPNKGHVSLEETEYDSSSPRTECSLEARNFTISNITERRRSFSTVDSH
ncbi:hypothetical protein T4D_7587 [Trichinella pseudospiralis]|uniref:Uncharacterized protein n=1 Tax=Trichinella pseudospiralis TaxID=6337 RepID=A0A0V1G5W5_TRIPS|nr:hypothetical protein T4D_7587 [Trichinella pseudospiralis]